MKNTLSPNLEVEKFRQKLESIPDHNKVGLGWFRFTCAVENLAYWQERIRVYFRADLVSRGRGWNGYLQSMSGLYSITIAYTPRLTEAERQAQGIKPQPNEGYMTVDIPQSALDSLSSENLFKFFIDFYGCEGATLTRVDVYHDDYCKIISPEQVYEACKSGSIGVPRFERMREWEEYNLRKRRTEGCTVYFGSRTSEKQLRFYDKRAESQGKQDCYRWEVQLMGKKAQAFQEWFLDALTEAMACDSFEASVERLAEAYKQVIKGSIAFHQMPEGQTLEDRPRNWAARTPYTWWWQELLAGLEPAKLVVNQVAPSLAGTVDWIRHQVTPGLALLRTVYRNWKIPFTAWLDRELEQGEERWTDRHFKLFQEAGIISPAT